MNAKADGEPGEVFVKIGKQGSTIAGMTQAVVVAISVALRHETPWPALYEKLKRMRFAPWNHEHTSIVDAIVESVEEIRQQLRERSDERQGQKRFEFENEE